MNDTKTPETEAVREAYAALNRGDIDGFCEILDLDIERIEPEGFPMSGTYLGIDTVREQFKKARATWAEGACEPERIFAVGDKVVVLAHVHVRLKDQTDWIDGHVGDVFIFRDGKATFFRTFVTPAEALEWAGAKAQ